MTRDGASRLRPLRTGDPAHLGRYRLLGRLGEGGMGTVFLAEDPAGRSVAVKVVRTDRVDDVEFRRRFRSEVRRVRQVPPFCTAEVLDADPDHEPPYLVVEFVDGPSLGGVVAAQGPLSPGNVHALAIGVATALTAIHGAGVIHRDLKPDNVLLAPGSPKVIDFGIARAEQGTDGLTSTGEMIGTVAYMAPERFGRDSRTALTPAADIFAWGAVVAYAATGRSPFGADVPAATAVRIMTEEPDLSGVPAPLRAVVADALAKDPAARPSAAQLLERLLGTGRDVAAALADSPALLAAADGARAAAHTAQAPGNEPAPEGGTVPEGPTVPAGWTAPVGAGAAGGTPPHAAPAAPVPAAFGLMAPARPRRRGWLGVALLAVGVAVGVVAGAVLLPRVWDPPWASGGRAPLAQSGPTGAPTPPAPPPTAPSTPPATSSPAPSPTPDRVVTVSDPLTGELYWRAVDAPEHQASCAFTGELVATRDSEGSFRCRGPRDLVTDFFVEVDVTILTEGSCAGVWFRFTDGGGGYAVRICQQGFYLVSHGLTTPTAVTPIRTFPFAAGDGYLPVGIPVRVEIVAQGERLSFLRDGTPVGGWTDPAPAAGRIALGVFRDPTQDPPAQPPFQVGFRDIRIGHF